MKPKIDAREADRIVKIAREGLLVRLKSHGYEEGDVIPDVVFERCLEDAFAILDLEALAPKHFQGIKDLQDQVEGSLQVANNPGAPQTVRAVASAEAIDKMHKNPWIKAWVLDSHSGSLEELRGLKGELRHLLGVRRGQ